MLNHQQLLQKLQITTILLLQKLQITTILMLQQLTEQTGLEPMVNRLKYVQVEMTRPRSVFAPGPRVTVKTLTPCTEGLATSHNDKCLLLNPSLRQTQQFQLLHSLQPHSLEC